MQRPAVVGTSVLMAAFFAAHAVAAPQTNTASQGNAVPQTNTVRAARAPVRVQALPARAHIAGMVITRDEPPKPVKGVTVRARDDGGRIVGTQRTDLAGHFAFEFEHAGSYFVEVVDDSGRVLAIEDVGRVAVTVEPGQHSTVILRLPGRQPAGAWASTAATILGAASAAGIGAFAASGQPASPEQ
jgi:hypothetical protein